jgi:hypothetical protein
LSLLSLDFSVFPIPKNPKFRRLEFPEDFLDFDSLSFRDCSCRSSREALDREEEASLGEFNDIALLLLDDLNENLGMLN